MVRNSRGRRGCGLRARCRRPGRGRGRRLTRASDEPAVSDTGGGGLVRLRLDVAYDGTDFAGWAAQPDVRTVQGVLTGVLARVLRLDPPPALTVAGRTDAGVHARGQVCHLDVAAPAPDDEALALIRQRLARALPPDVRVHAVTRAPAGFDARFAALSRTYVYRLCDDAAAIDPLRRRDVVVHRQPLDVAAMAAAADGLVGEHDFAAYCRRRPGATTIRELQVLEPRRSRRHGAYIDIEVRADAFCHSMVRALVGALTVVGSGRRPASWPADVLAAGVRDPRVPVMPAHGLTLESVRYPAAAAMAARVRVTRTVRQPTVPGNS